MNQCRQGWLANTPSSSFCLPSKPRSYGLASRRASDWHARAWRVGCVAEAPFGADKTPTLDKPPTPAASLTGSLTLQQRGVSRHHHPRRHPRHTLFRLCKVILTSDQNVRVQPQRLIHPVPVAIHSFPVSFPVSRRRRTSVGVVALSTLPCSSRFSSVTEKRKLRICRCNKRKANVTEQTTPDFLLWSHTSQQLTNSATVAHTHTLQVILGSILGFLAPALGQMKPC